MQELCPQLGDPKHLERQRAENLLRDSIERGDDVSEANGLLASMLISSVWEKVYGALIGISELLKSQYIHEETIEVLKENSVGLLKHPEFRVRTALAQALANLSIIQGISVYLMIKPALFARISESFVPGLIESDDALHKDYVLKGGSGWQNLETSLKTLQQFMRSLTTQFDDEIDEEFWRALDGACIHPNRFVREIGQFLCGDLCVSLSPATLQAISEKLATYIANGLTDNWSQVRYAASASVRNLLTTADITQYEALLVPRMCLNRYYVAEGVRNHAQETWILYTNNEGRQVVARNATAVAEFYIAQCSADNHAVREAACLTIAELASKVGDMVLDVICGYVPRLLAGLLDCFKDESWPVRDAACLACAEFVSVFPQFCETRLAELKELWVTHLADNINSVREHSAAALRKGLAAYKSTPNDFTVEVIEYLNLNLESVRGEAEFEKTHKAEPSNQEMYSCGSLAPKLKRGGGCMDHGFSREKHPWEVTDGCIFMLKELSSVEKDFVVSKFSALADIARLENYSSYHYLKMNIWTVVPEIAEKLGKLVFKNNMEDLVHGMFRDCAHENRTISVPAQECIKSIAKLLGVNIFKGRVELMHPSYRGTAEKLLAN